MKGFYRLIKLTMESNSNKKDYMNNNDDSIMNCVTKAYMYILRIEDWGKDLTIDHKDDDFYHSLFLKYNDLTDYTMKTLKTFHPSIHAIINEVVCRKPKSVRRTKKNAARIRKDAIKAIKTYRSNENLKKAKKSMDSFYTAIRESFIVFSYSLSSYVYNSIPNDLTTNINGKDYYIRSLYLYDKTSDKYKIDKSLTLSNSVKKDIQYKISKYVCAGIHDEFQ